jgi:predicted phosphodiesterase
LADPTSRTKAVPIVTLRSLANTKWGQSGLESTTSPDGKTVQRYAAVLGKLDEETRQAGPSVLIAVADRDASVLQSRMAEGGDAGPPLPGGGLEAQFGEGLTGGDIWGWISSVFDHIDRNNWHPIVPPPNDTVGALVDAGRIAVIGDWGTNLYGAPMSAASIKRTGKYEMLLHLGDIYYSGTDKETKQRFLDVWPTSAGKVSRALNGNHEMYSGGYAYFDSILPKFKQSSSYFAVQNTHWLLVGLDTAHTDHSLDTKQVDWLKRIVQKGGPRKLILFSHHQPFSRLDKQGPNLQAALADLLQQKAITTWYWGHEHNCIIYDRHWTFGFLGRCIGHGGIPSPRKGAVRDADLDRRVGSVAWMRLSETGDSPACLVLDGENPLVPGEEKKFGPHGYLTLEFNGPDLIERVHLPNGDEIFRARAG